MKHLERFRPEDQADLEGKLFFVLTFDEHQPSVVAWPKWPTFEDLDAFLKERWGADAYGARLLVLKGPFSSPSEFSFRLGGLSGSEFSGQIQSSPLSIQPIKT